MHRQRRICQDHLHMLIESNPSTTIESIVRRLKQISTFEIWKNHDSYLKKHLWKERTFWTDGYFVSTVGEVSEATVIEYIENQG